MMIKPVTDSIARRFAHAVMTAEAFEDAADRVLMVPDGSGGAFVMTTDVTVDDTGFVGRRALTFGDLVQLIEAADPKAFTIS